MANSRSFPAGVALAVVLAVLLFPSSMFAAKDTIPTPKEFGVYAKTDKALRRILPNIVSDEKGVYYIERNKPQTFTLGSIEYFIVYGKYQFQYLTLNPMVPFKLTTLGIARYMFGKETDIVVTKRSDNLYTVKPKGLFGRGYYSLWIEDSAWDFLIE